MTRRPRVSSLDITPTALTLEEVDAFVANTVLPPTADMRAIIAAQRDPIMLDIEHAKEKTLWGRCVLLAVGGAMFLGVCIGAALSAEPPASLEQREPQRGEVKRCVSSKQRIKYTVMPMPVFDFKGTMRIALVPVQQVVTEACIGRQAKEGAPCVCNEGAKGAPIG